MVTKPGYRIVTILPTSAHSPRKRGGGFTFEVQHLAPEDFCRGVPVKALSGGVVIGLDEVLEPLGGEESKIGLARKGSAHASDGILDAALLPRGVGIAKEGLEPELMKLVVASELGAVVEGDGLAKAVRQRPEGVEQLLGDRVCSLAG